MCYYIKSETLDAKKIRGSRITTSTLFTRLHQDFKLKFAPLFALLTHLLKQT